MVAKRLDGQACAAKIKARVKAAVNQRLQEGLPQPGLAVILVGDNPASASYVNHKRKACAEVGIKSVCHRLPESAQQEEIEALIEACNQSPDIHGILLQLPLPKHILADALLEKIHPNKDVDGFHPYNAGLLLQRKPGLRACTPKGIMTLLAETDEDLAGKNALVVGASNIVGRPMGLELLLAKCTVTISHRFTRDLAHHVQQADLLVSATGHPGIIQSDWIKPGAIVIDVGFCRKENGEITGDIEFETAERRAGWITPVPGGVGPMTVATVVENTLQAAEIQDVIDHAR